MRAHTIDVIQKFAASRLISVDVTLQPDYNERDKLVNAVLDS